MSKLKWCIKRTEDNSEEVNEWVYKTTGSFDLIREYYVHSEPFEASQAFISHLIHPGFHEINLDEFRLLTNPEDYSEFSVYVENINSYLSFNTGYVNSVYSPTPLRPVVSKPVADELMERWKEKEFNANPLPEHVASVKFGNMEKSSESIIDPAYIIPIQSITINPQPVSEERKKEMEKFANSCTWLGHLGNPVPGLIRDETDSQREINKHIHGVDFDETERTYPTGGSFGKPKGWNPIEKNNPFKSIDFVNELPADISEIIERIGARRSDKIFIEFNPGVDSWLYKIFHENQASHCKDLEGPIFDNLLKSDMSEADKLRFIDNALAPRPTSELIPSEPFEDPEFKAEIRAAIINGFFDFYHNRPAHDYELDDMCGNVIEVIKKHFGKR